MNRRRERAWLRPHPGWVGLHCTAVFSLGSRGAGATATAAGVIGSLRRPSGARCPGFITWLPAQGDSALNLLSSGHLGGLHFPNALRCERKCQLSVPCGSNQEPLLCFVVVVVSHTPLQTMHVVFRWWQRWWSLGSLCDVIGLSHLLTRPGRIA